MPTRSLSRALAALAGVVLALGLTGCDLAGKDAPGGAQPTPGTDAEVRVPAYFVGHTPRGPRLYLEQHDAGGSDRLTAAAEALLAGRPRDPDYRSLLPRGSLAGTGRVAAHRTGDRVTFSVSVASHRWTRRPHGLSREEARLAVQELLYTLRAAAGDGSEAARIEFRLDGRAVPFLGVPSGATAAPRVRTLALVNVLEPDDQAVVTGDTISASGLADSFEAHVPWQVLDDRGRRVLNGFTTAQGWGTRLYPWQASVDISSLQPGRYTFLAKTSNPSGREGFEPTEDTKTFRVS
ncbi:Gmad2 immunoglobulin-like domain-containing protein [Nocardioides panacisoli]|uniref:Bacterial spore germination immunoglobulin-like domain-containing protein n=1 Tax=Nocardioides panacisoli TaxID=627624 RepID=A0ABP7IYN5_9ACTN